MGFGFSKLLAERTGNLEKDSKVNNRIEIISLEDSKLTIGKEEKQAITIKFSFVIEYENAGNIDIAGHLIYYSEPEEVNKILENWKKEQKATAEFTKYLYNYVIRKCTVKALQLEEEVGIPFHIILPKFEIKKKDESKE